MSFEEKFKENISEFERYGNYQYQYDQTGNCIFASSSNDFSQVFLAFPISNFEYSTNKILEFYDPTFSEFKPYTQSIVSDKEKQLQGDLEIVQAKNDLLTQQLNNMIVSSSIEQSNPNGEAIKQVILELRKSLGQGRVDSDFSEEFPYTPSNKLNNNTSNTTNIIKSEIITENTSISSPQLEVNENKTTIDSTEPNFVITDLNSSILISEDYKDSSSQWEKDKMARQENKRKILR